MRRIGLLAIGMDIEPSGPPPPPPAPVAQQSPSTWREFGKGAARMFWKFVGLEDVAGDVETHGEAVRKGAVLRFILIVVLLTVWGTYSSTRSHMEESKNEEVQKVKDQAQWNEKLADSRRQLAERESDKLRAERDRAVTVMENWKETALKEFPFDDFTAGLEKLHAKTETILAMFKSSIANALNEPINAATCTVAIETGEGTPETATLDIFSGGYAAYCIGRNTILTAHTSSHTKKPGGRYEFVGTASVFDPMIGRPVNMVTGAEYIEIGFSKEVLKGETSILGGTVMWVLNNRVTLRYTIPPQTSKTVGGNQRIWIRDLREGLSQLREIGKKESTPPVGSPTSPSPQSPQSTKHNPSAPPP